MIKKRVPKEYLGAFKPGHRKGVREYVDDDFSYKLLEKALDGCLESKKALEFLTRFNNEFLRGVVKKNDPKALHNTPKLYKEACDAHNARRRDLTCVLKSGKMKNATLVSAEVEILEEYSNKTRSMNFESTLIEFFRLDAPEVKKK